MLGWSFRGATEGGEPGIHKPRSVGYGFRARRFAAPRNDAACDSNFKIAELVRDNHEQRGPSTRLPSGWTTQPRKGRGSAHFGGGKRDYRRQHEQSMGRPTTSDPRRSSTILVASALNPILVAR